MKHRRWSLLCVLVTWLSLGCQVLFGGVTVNKASATDDSLCTPGDSRCNGEYLLSCTSGDAGWTLKETCASGDLCDAKDSRCSACKDGDFRCAGAERQQCAADGSGWHTVETCSAENLCSESSCSGCVTNGQLDCSLGSQLRQCQGALWVALDDCGSHALCAATTAFATTALDWNQKCVAPGCPEAGKYRCDGTILERCPPERDDWVKVDPCDNSALCEAAAERVNSAQDSSSVSTFDMCKPACPTAGAFLCDGTTLKQCRDDQTAYDILKDCPANTECDPLAGDCGQLCNEGQYQCNGATLRRCASNGHWANDAQCETAALCSASADGKTGSCVASPCGKNAYACNGAVLQKCKDDRTGYQDSSTCASPALCDASNARCVDKTCATANAYQCFGQDLKQCAPDFTAWRAVTTCPAGQYCNSGANPGCLTQCPDNPLRCNGKLLEHCAAATGWTTQATCSTNDLCTCAITDPDGAGPLSNSCLNGLYKDGCGNVVCGGTLAGYQCKGAELQKCQAGRNGWDKSATCGAANLCYPGEAPSYSGGYCLTCPTAGELACNSSTLRVCSADRKAWNTSQTCGLGCMAVQNGQDYCAACKTGTSQCTGQTLQTCPSDRKAWQNKSCANVCDAAHAQCDQCAADSYWCSGATLNKCSSDGQSQTMSVCLSSMLCNAGAKKCDACAAGQRQCKGSNLQICSADKTGFVNGTECGTAGCNAITNLCNPALVCTPSAYQCASTGGLTLQKCDAAGAAWATVQSCAAICDAAHGECDECLAPAFKCASNVLQDCTAAGHWETKQDCMALLCNPAGTCDAAPPPPSP